MAALITALIDKDDTKIEQMSFKESKSISKIILSNDKAINGDPKMRLTIMKFKQ